jgi:phosphatidate cytidylyltransferase
LVLAAGLGVALSDIGAFCTGKLLKGPKLAPRLSPNKTWGGLLGNILGAAIAVALTTFAFSDLSLWQHILLIAAIGLGSAWGDLLESLLKRQGNVKEAGELLPCFGGLLDRADSFLLVVPLVYYTVQFSSALKL